MIFQWFFSLFSECVSILKTKFSDPEETKNMKITTPAHNGAASTPCRKRRLGCEKFAGATAHQKPDGLGGSG